ncbi:MAG: hypothetical protein JNL04_24565, partial [Rhodospirillaceae bacterium]|nr:hypothetical protein [Rhodospirillaceae bacterium]
FVACTILSRVRGRKARIAAPAARISSRSGADENTARYALHQVAPVGEKDLCIDRAIAGVRPFMVPSALQGAAS